MSCGSEARVPLRVPLWAPTPLGPRHLPLSSSAPTQKPDIHFLEALESGRPTNLTCRLSLVCDGGRAFSFSWAGDALDAVDPETLQSSVLTFTPRRRDHGSNLTCRVELQGDQVTMERTIRLNVSCESGGGLGP